MDIIPDILMACMVSNFSEFHVKFLGINPLPGCFEWSSRSSWDSQGRPREISRGAMASLNMEGSKVLQDLLGITVEEARTGWFSPPCRWDLWDFIDSFPLPPDPPRPPPPPPPPPLCQLLIAVGTAGPQPGISRAQRAPLEVTARWTVRISVR